MATMTASAWDCPTVRPGLPLIFPDTAQMSSANGVTIRLHEGVKDREPVLRKDRPWEQKGCHVYGSVWRMDDGSWRMWYNDWSYSLVADSTDGRNWVKPDLAAAPLPDYPLNNRCSGASGHCNSLIFDGFETVPERRYKHIGTVYQYNADWSINTNVTGYYTCTSADGLVFTGLKRALYGWDTVSLALHPETGDIFCYHKIMTPGIAGRPEKRRVVYLARTSDFENWSAPELVLAPDAEDDRSVGGNAGNRRMDIYTMTAFPYAGGFLGFPKMFQIDESTPAEHGETTDHGYCEVQLVTSPDGIAWSRTPGREYVITRGETGNWDCGGVFGLAGGEVVCEGDESMLYYYGLDNAHGRTLRAQPSEISTGRAVWRRWGFASVDAPESGEFVTKPLKLGTDDVRLNAAPCGTGAMSVAVTVLAEDGRTPIAVSRPVCADATQAKLVWRDDATVPTNTVVVLSFALEHARVYAVECEGVRQKYTPLDRPVWKYDTSRRPPDAVTAVVSPSASEIDARRNSCVCVRREGGIETRPWTISRFFALDDIDVKDFHWKAGFLLWLQ